MPESQLTLTAAYAPGVTVTSTDPQRGNIGASALCRTVYSPGGRLTSNVPSSLDVNVCTTRPSVPRTISSDVARGRSAHALVALASPPTYCTGHVGPTLTVPRTPSSYGTIGVGGVTGSVELAARGHAANAQLGGTLDTYDPSGQSLASAAHATGSPEPTPSEPVDVPAPAPGVLGGHGANAHEGATRDTYDPSGQRSTPVAHAVPVDDDVVVDVAVVVVAGVLLIGAVAGAPPRSTCVHARAPTMSTVPMAMSQSRKLTMLPVYSAQQRAYNRTWHAWCVQLALRSATLRGRSRRPVLQCPEAYQVRAACPREPL